MVTATSTTAAADSDWFDANFRQVLGVGAATAGRQLAAPQMLAALGQRFTRVVDPASRRVNFIRNGEALQLMDDPAEVDPLIATFAASQLSGPRAALATIEADLCMPGSCEGDASRTVAAIREMLGRLIEVSARRDGTLRTQLLISQLIGTRTVGSGRTISTVEFGLVLRLRSRLAESHRLSPSSARELALDIVDQAIAAIQSFSTGIQTRAGRGRPLRNFAETLHGCALHISERVIEVRRTLVEIGIDGCELARAKIGAIPVPDLLAALETQPAEWSCIIDDSTPDGQAAIAASAQALTRVIDALTADAFAALFKVGDEAKQQLKETWTRFAAYTSVTLHDLQRSLDGAAAASSSAGSPGSSIQSPPGTDDDLISAPDGEQEPL